LDEAFLDVRGVVRLFGTPASIATALRSEVSSTLQLDCSVGVGRSKMVAKLASRAAKPRAGRPGRTGKQPGRGVVVVEADDEEAFLHPLPVEALWGVGPATATRLHALGVRSVGDLAQLPPAVLVRRLGKAHGAHLSALARGEDRDPVVPDRPTKSVGHEETFRHDIDDRAALLDHCTRMAESVASAMRSAGQAGRTVTVKVKYADFSLVTRSHTLPVAVDTGKAVGAVGSALLEDLDLREGVRLLGVSVSGLVATLDARQLSFDFDRAPDEARRQEIWEDVMVAVDAVRGRYGAQAVGTASMVTADGIKVPARRDAPWGPAT
jgi:DNA polymerase IV